MILVLENPTVNGINTKFIREANTFMEGAVVRLYQAPGRLWLQYGGSRGCDSERDDVGKVDRGLNCTERL